MKQRKDSHLITGEEMNASCLGSDGKWRYNGGRGGHARGREKKGKRRKVVRATRRKKPWALLSTSRPERERNKDRKSEAD